MWRLLGGVLLILVSVVLLYEALTLWGELTTLTSFMLGAAFGAILATGIAVLTIRPTFPGSRRDDVRLPSPYDRGRWR